MLSQETCGSIIVNNECVPYSVALAVVLAPIFFVTAVSFVLFSFMMKWHDDSVFQIKVPYLLSRINTVTIQIKYDP